MQPPGYLLAIDVGTTTTRCILFDLDGVPVVEARREPRIHYPQPQWAEVDPESWWASTVAVVREVVEQAPVPPKHILGIGLCGLKHAAVPIDRRGAPLANAMLWMDQRCAPQADRMSRECGDVIAGVLGGAGEMGTSPSAPKLRWIAEHQPELLRATHKFLLAKDFIRYRLTGTLATDPSDAGGTCLYDRRTGDWSPEMLALVGVPREKMPDIVPATSVAGGVTAEAARETGLAPGTPVVVGGGDVQCTLLGANASSSAFVEGGPPAPVRSCLYLGTAAWLLAAQAVSPNVFGATATTGAAVKWLRSLFDQEDAGCPAYTYECLLREAESAPLGANGLLFLPHLMGKRGPIPDPNAKGVFFGLTLAHGRGEIARAVLEGCAFQLRRIADALSPSGLGEMVVVGGGAKGALWLRIIADVTGIRLDVPRVLEAGALGAAILAGVGVGVYPNVQEAAERLVLIVARVVPDAERRARYACLYDHFLALEDKVAPLYSAEI